MARNRNKNRIFRFNRRIRGQTNYTQRLKLLRSNLTRVVVRRSNKNVLIQFTNFEDAGDRVISSSKSMELVKLGFTLNTGNLVSAYLTGLLAGKKAIKAGLKTDCIVDLGLQKSLYGNRVYAAIKGVVDSGVKVRVADVVFPSQERLDGTHLSVKDAAKNIEKVKKAIEAMK